MNKVYLLKGITNKNMYNAVLGAGLGVGCSHVKGFGHITTYGGSYFDADAT